MTLKIYLPLFSEFTTGVDSFVETTSISLSNVPFTNGNYTGNTDGSSFKNIAHYSITSDLVSQPLKIAILTYYNKEPIYDPFILGDNSNYGSEELQQWNCIPSDIEVLEMYLAVRDQYPTMALKHTRVLALQGMTTEAIALFKESLSKQQQFNPNPIDCYFYGDHVKPRYLEFEYVVPLMELTQFTRPSRLVISDGIIMREGMHAILQWMVENKEKGYFRNLEFLQITRNKCSSYQVNSNATILTTSIVNYLQTICEDEVDFPKLINMDFSENAFNEHNDGFDQVLINACSQTTRVIPILARDNAALGKDTYPKMCGGAEFPTYKSYEYYDLYNSDVELQQCRYTWNWEFGDEYPIYSPNIWNKDPNSECVKPVIPSTQAPSQNPTSDPNKPISPSEKPEISFIGDVVISSEDDCELLYYPGVSSITINAGYCNGITDDLVISDYPYIESITIKSSNTEGISTLANLNSLTISNNPLLKSIVVEDGYGISNGVKYGSCVFVKSLYLTSDISFA